MKILKRKRKTSNVVASQSSELAFSNVTALADWIANNISDQHKQEKLMLQGVRNQYRIVVTREDRAEWVTRSFGSAR